MFERILTISGKPGLYRLLSSGRNMFIVEMVDASKKRLPVHNADKVVMLDDIAIYTDIVEHNNLVGIMYRQGCYARRYRNIYRYRGGAFA